MSRRRRQEDLDNSSEEAREENAHIDDENEGQPASEESGEDLMENAERDYEPNEEQDRYADDGVDEEEIEDDPEARRRAEQQLNRQGRRIHHEGDNIDDYMDDDEMEDELRMKQRQAYLFEEQEDEEFEERRFLDVEEVKGKLAEWIKQDQTVKYIKAKFRKFLLQFKGEADYPIYGQRLRQMCTSNKQSIEIQYDHLKTALPTIAMWIGLEPYTILPYLNVIAYGLACRHFSFYKDIFPEVFVKIVKLPLVDHIRDLRHQHLRKLIKVVGVITIRSEVFNQLKKIIYKCARCGLPKGPFFINEVNNTNLGSCASCQATGPFFIDKQRTVYRNYQKITVQESPSQVLPGRIPRQKQVVLFGDNIDAARPGDEVQITGIYMHRYEVSLNARQGFPLFATLIEANVITKTADDKNRNYDQSKEQDFRKFSQSPDLDHKIFGSIAPSIYGHENVKAALTIAMFGGIEKLVQSHKVRGDINVLLLGDPGVAKSQFLKSVQKVFHRCVYTTGKGASAVGLTASVRRDVATNEWKLEAGALVLADKGICLIDEFDKMNEHDRTSIHEAMEQQSISISKAGIVTSLRARCSVIAAANPLQGRYNPQEEFKNNVDLSDPILSRFDILCVVRDEVIEEIDHDLSTFVINSHILNHPYNSEYDMKNEFMPENRNNKPQVEHEFLKHYIRYARDKIKPQLPEKNLEIIKNFWKKLRESSIRTAGMHVATRHIESIVRIATAHAKMRLRNEIKKEDIDFGIRVMLKSFIETQKYNTANQLRKQFAAYL